MLLAAMTLAFSECGKETEETDVTMYEEIRGVNKLVVAEMKISKMATIEDLSTSQASGPDETFEALMNKLKIGKRVAAYRYNTYLEAYVDFSKLRPEDIQVDEENKTISIKLPEMEIAPAGRDAGIEEVHYRVSGLRSHISEKERAALKERMNASMMKEINENQEYKQRLKQQGEEKVYDFIRQFSESRGYRLVNNLLPAGNCTNIIEK